jgi:hypothetical protein
MPLNTARTTSARSDTATHQRTLHTVQLDNRWVVPHNRYLSLRYDCHINLEVCINVASIKYLYKYAYKGSDRAAADVTTDPNSTTHYRNEIQQYLDARYLSAGEAVWRLLGFRMHSEVPHVTRLAVHLPQQQQVVFDDDADLHHVLERAQHTTLTRWMDFNRIARERHSRQPAGTPLPDCLTTTYDRFPSIATWDKASRTWHARRGGSSVVGRVYFVPPSAGEKYYLRMLLHHVPGCTSFEDLRTTPTSATPHASYQAACDARGLLATDSQRERCLAEAVSYQMPYQLRQLFATMLAHDTPARPMQLWQRFQASMTEDYLHKAQQVSQVPAPATYYCHLLPLPATYCRLLVHLPPTCNMQHAY